MEKPSQFLSVMLIFLAFSLIGCKSQDTGQALSSDGVSISYNLQGKGEPALVFVHGWSCDKSVWKYQVAHFAKNHKVVTIDLGGHGQSGLGRKEWTVQAYGKDVAAVVQKLSLNKVVLVGHSMGGPVIVETARQIPGRVIGLVGADTFHDIETGYSKEMLAEILVRLKADFATEAKNFVAQMFPSDADQDIVEWTVNKISSANPEVGIGSMEKLGDYDLKEAVKDIKVPFYSISSDFWPTALETNKKYAESFEMKLMPGTGHFVMLEDPDKFNQILTVILNELGR